MERYQVMKSNKGLAWVLVTIGGILIAFNLVLLVRYLIDQSQTDSSLASIILYFFQGVTLVVLGGWQLRSSKYYIQWNEEEIWYYLPGDKGVEKILISEIERVDIRLYEIRLKVDGQDKIINLEHAQFEEIRKIKEKFEKIKP